MMIFGWRLDEGLRVPGCAPLWAWIPVMEQEELFGGPELAGDSFYGDGDGVTAQVDRLFSDR